MKTAIFDLGGVLVDWNPRYLYRKLFADPEEMEDFLARVCTPEWNARQDGGRPISEAVAELTRQHPEKAQVIEAYYDRWPEMLGGELNETVEILRKLKIRGTALFFLTNWSKETFPVARARFDFLRWFNGGIVSGEVAVKKPDAAIYRLLLDHYAIDPNTALFIDDRQENLEPAVQLGMAAHQFTTPTALREELRRLQLLE